MTAAGPPIPGGTSALALAVTGCANLLGLGPAPHLYRVTPKSTYPANLPRPSGQLLVDVPLAPAGLDTGRIALSRSAVSIDYFADSEWIDRVPLLVQTALLDSFENSKASTAIDRNRWIAGGSHLKTDIRHFEAFTTVEGAPEVWVAIRQAG
jgi:cholesterol transport system auxiliary component